MELMLGPPMRSIRFYAFDRKRMNETVKKHRDHRKIRRSGDRGFILLVTLVLLTLAALALIEVSRAAILRVQAATQAEADLQRRWGCLSCQSTLLPRGSAILKQAESQNQQPVAILQRTLVLGNQTFNLTFGDESAKANVAMLIRRHGKDQAELAIRRLCLGSPLAAGSVHFRMLPEGPLPECFGDVFDGATPNLLFSQELGSAPQEMLTCWGDGRLNIHRAPETVLREICTGALDLTQIHLLTELQQTKPTISTAEALQELQLTARQRREAEDILTDSSNCSSLWIECRTPRRSYWVLVVESNSLAAAPLVRHYAW
jgi:hypothetical protein